MIKPERWVDPDAFADNPEEEIEHCKICGTCVVDHSHHCGAFGKCIGGKNQYEFYCFLLLTGINATLIVLRMFGLILVEAKPTSEVPATLLGGNNSTLPGDGGKI